MYRAYVTEIYSRANSRVNSRASTRQNIDPPSVTVTSFDEGLEVLFAQLDTSKEGFVSPANAMLVLKQKFPGLNESSMRAMISNYDLDNNEKIDYKEFIGFFNRIKNKSDELNETFERLDADGSGDLDIDELLETLQEICMVEPFMVQDLVAQFDTNGDGKIDKEEFMDLWTNLSG